MIYLHLFHFEIIQNPSLKAVAVPSNTAFQEIHASKTPIQLGWLLLSEETRKHGCGLEPRAYGTNELHVWQPKAMRFQAKGPQKSQGLLLRLES